MSMLSIENGCFAYRGGPQILENINAEARSGEILAVLGPNGAGKTTLLRCMMDMLRWRSGRSLLDGEDIHGMPARRLWSRMAYVPQARSAAVSYTALQTVLLGRSAHIGAFSSPGDEDMRIARGVMDRLGIAELADKPCGEMSGGELQMVLIARAMAAEPEMLVLDEPESNLDFRNQLIVLDTISTLASEGMTCVFNTHYPAHALQRADRSLILSKGGACIFGSTPQVVTEANIRRAFGVEAVIGEIETPGSVLRSVMPVSISEELAGEDKVPGEGEARKEAALASVAVIMSSNEHADKINRCFSEYERLIAGRMGLPHRSSGQYIINATLYGDVSDIEELTHRLGLIPGISVKTTYAKRGTEDIE